jgi:hypothetical protein
MNHPACWGWKRPWPLGTIPAITTRELTIEFYKFHANRCAVCNKKLYDPDKRGVYGQAIVGCLDENHYTGMIRGFLCWSCNTTDYAHPGLFYVNEVGAGRTGHKNCNRCKMMDMYRLLSAADILGIKMRYSTFDLSYRMEMIRDWGE